MYIPSLEINYIPPLGDGKFGGAEPTHSLISSFSDEVKVALPCLSLCDPMDCVVHGILQARILEGVAFPFSRGYSQPRDQTQVSHIADGFFTS